MDESGIGGKMSGVIFKWLRERKIGTDTIFVVATFGDDHIVWTIVISEDSFKRNLVKTYFSGNVDVKNEPKKKSGKYSQCN